MVEVLTVIAVIGILAALILPTILSTREATRQTSCLSNLRQIGNGMSLYVQDHDEVLPFWNTAYLTAPSTPEAPEKLWKAAVHPYVRGGNAVSTVMNGAIREEAAVWRCPSIGGWQDGLGVDERPPTRPATASYGMSMFIAYDFFGPEPDAPLTRYRRGLPLAALRAPTETVLIGDGGLSGRIDTPLQRRWQTYLRLYDNPRVQNWERRDAHGEGANYLYCDGHGAWKPATEMYPASPVAARRSARVHFAATEWDHWVLREQ